MLWPNWKKKFSHKCCNDRSMENFSSRRMRWTTGLTLLGPRRQKIICFSCFVCCASSLKLIYLQQDRSCCSSTSSTTKVVLDRSHFNKNERHEFRKVKIDNNMGIDIKKFFLSLARASPSSVKIGYRMLKAVIVFGVLLQESIFWTETSERTIFEKVFAPRCIKTFSASIDPQSLP